MNYQRMLKSSFKKKEFLKIEQNIKTNDLFIYLNFILSLQIIKLFEIKYSNA